MRRVCIFLMVLVIFTGCSKKKKKKDKFIFLPPANPNVLYSITLTESLNDANTVTDSTGALPAPTITVFSAPGNKVDFKLTPDTQIISVTKPLRYRAMGAAKISDGQLFTDFTKKLKLDPADADAQSKITVEVGFDKNLNWKLDDGEVERRVAAKFIGGGPGAGMVDIDADTDQSGAIEGSGIEEALEETPPGLIILPNINDDDAISSASLSPDSSNSVIDDGGDTDDITQLIVRQISDLDVGDEVAVRVPNADVSNIRIFPTIGIGCTAIIDSTHGSSVTVDGTPYKESVLDSDAIRAGDVILGIEGINSAMNASVEVAIRNASSLEEYDNDTIIVCVAPIIMLSNIEPAVRTFVTNTDSAFATAVSNAVTAAMGYPATSVLASSDVWVQDEFQAMYAVTPASTMPMIQDTARDRPLDPYGEEICYTFDYAHLTYGTSPSAPDFGGNMEISPPVPGYPGGVIYTSTALSTTMKNFYISQYAQTLSNGQIIQLNANWLAVGHVDEFFSFIPVPTTGDTTDFRLLVTSPAISKALLEDLAASGNGSAPVFSGKPGATTVSALLASGALWSFNRSCQAYCDTGRDLMVSSLGLTDCITKPIADGGNTGSGALSRALMCWPYHTAATTIQWRLTFTSSTAFDLQYNAGLGWFGDGSGSRSTDFLSSSKIIVIPTDYWSGTPQAGDRFTFTTTKNSQIIDLPVWFEDYGGMGVAVAHVPDIINLQVVNAHLLVSKPFGPLVSSVDRIEKFMSDALAHTGCVIDYIDNWAYYHAYIGEIHCGTEVIRTPRAEFKWWEP
ncbi:MAG: hypothetical protein E3J72_07035 [Planctomycetota bacterium]|nr:MAG: hypothetical protein E3J72_07035 [Planctomycetota bacterium]